MIEDLVSCPVCIQTGVDDDDECPECGWPLNGALLLGGVTPERQQSFESRLQAARRYSDLRAAALAAGYPDGGDPTVLRRLLVQVRGDPKEPPRPEDAVASVAHLRSVPAARSSEPDEALLDSLEALADSVAADRGTATSSDYLTVTEVRAGGLSSIRFTSDEYGTVSAGAVQETAWTEIITSLPADPDVALMCLAAGVAVPVDVRRAVEREVDALGAGKDRLPGPLRTPGRQAVLLIRVPLWRLPARVVRNYQEWILRSAPSTQVLLLEVPASAWSLTPAGVGQLLAQVRTRHSYGLVVAGVTPRDSTVELRVRQLFRAGQTAASATAVTVRLRGAVTHGQPTLITVAATPTDSGPDGWRPLVTWAVQLRAGVEYDVEFTLLGPDRLSHQGRSVDTSSPLDPGTLLSPAAFQNARRELPNRYDESAQAPALAIAIEQGGTENELEGRITVARELIQAIEAGVPQPDTVRYALLAYADHPPDGRRAAVVSMQAFSRADRVLDRLARLRPVAPVNQHAAPVEDVLHQAARLDWDSIPGRRVLLVVGSRMAHPQRRDGEVQHCTFNLDWRNGLELLREHRIQVVAQWRPPAWVVEAQRHSTRAQELWRRLGAGSIATRPIPDPSPTDAHQLARRLGLLTVESSTPLLFPLAAARP